MRDVVRQMVSAIPPGDTLEADHRRNVLAWIDSGDEIFRLVKPATPPKHLVSYCALVDTERERLLLVDHRDAQLWLPSGGHVDPGEHPAVAASREIQEELGIDPEFHAAIGPAPLMITVTTTAGLSAPHTDVSLWFAFAGSSDDELIPDAGEFVAVQWWDFADIAHGPGTRFDPHLPRFVAKLTGTSNVQGVPAS